MPDEVCKNCGHPEEDHVGYWVKKDGSKELIPGKLCFWAEGQGYSQDLCGCPGFNVEGSLDFYFDTLLKKSGVSL